MATTTYDNYNEMLNALRDLATKAAKVEGADSVGAFLPIGKFGESRGYGEFSSLSEWLDDFADTLQDFLEEDDEVESWSAD